ncbi:ABC transporter permease [Cellulomonas sp. Y8]|uniref:ABC transporter permease n=1 Tax=Cellulomonas sp. Y8 TaxID=2591145 RepID=UPI003D73A46B
MLRFILRRLGSGVVLLVALAVLGFFLLQLGSTDTAQRIAGQNAGPEAVAVIEERYGLDQPVLVQFRDWASAAVTGDFGRSWFTGQPVLDSVTSRIAVTSALAVGAVVLTAIVAILLGTLAATRRGVVDRAVQVLAVIGQAIPGFLVAVGLVLLFAIQLRWFPATGYTRFSDSAGDWVRSVTLPIIALTIGAIGGVAQLVRSSMLDVLDKDFVRTLRSRGLPYRRIVYRNVLRNAAGPALSLLGLQFVTTLGGAVIVEQVFSIPGIGPLAVSSTGQSDIPVVMGIILATGTVVLVVNTLVDLASAWINPKVRLS